MIPLFSKFVDIFLGVYSFPNFLAHSAQLHDAVFFARFDFVIDILGQTLQ
jgi:hypothetical protein